MDLSKVIVELFAETKEYTEKMTRAEEKMLGFGKSTEKTSSQLEKFANKASTAMIGFGIAAVAYGVDAAMKFNESLDAVKNQSNLTDAQIEKLRGHIIDTSNQTGISADQLAKAALITSQAGITGAQSYKLLNDAAKAAVITNSDVVSTTQAIVSVQALHIAKGMDITTLTGKLVAGSKSFVGGLQAEEQMLKGRVGVALANYGLKLNQIIPLGAEFSKVGLPSRSVASFTQALGKIEQPTKAYAAGLAKVGLNAGQLAKDVRSGNVVQLLKDINEAAIKGGGPLSQYTNAVFGSAGGGAASVLIKNLKDVVKVQQQVAGGGATSLAGSFATASKQLGPQLKIFEQNLTNALISVGQVVLPKLAGLLSGLNGFFKNKGAVEAVGITLGAAFIASIGLKFANLVKGIMGLFGKSAQVIATDANTDALIANTDALLGKVGSSLATGEGLLAGGGATALEGLGAAGVASVAGIAVGIAAEWWGLSKIKSPVVPVGRYGMRNTKTGAVQTIGGDFANAAALANQRNTVKIRVTH